MGDRAQARVKGRGSEVWLYTHWGGSSLDRLVQGALRKNLRWGDVGYLTRIIFDVMSKGDQGNETGFGIEGGQSLKHGDVFHVVTVDVDNQRVTMTFHSQPPNYPKDGWTFMEYCKFDFDAAEKVDGD